MRDHSLHLQEHCNREPCFTTFLDVPYLRRCSCGCEACGRAVDGRLTECLATLAELLAAQGAS